MREQEAMVERERLAGAATGNMSGDDDQKTKYTVWKVAEGLFVNLLTKSTSLHVP